MKMIMSCMNKYLSSINKINDLPIVQEILKQAETYKTPIITEEGINFLIQLIKISKTKKVLEIGSAIGYSAIMMALNTCCEITTIEKNEECYLLAKSNIKNAGLEDRVTLIHNDALEVDLDAGFDLLFIDAAKAQYLKFLEKFKVNLNKGGIVVCDNLLFHGLVENLDSV
ncbi:MAG: O-methyltransferase, partial [Candidatus Izemoplasmatales bacterium]